MIVSRLITLGVHVVPAFALAATLGAAFALLPFVPCLALLVRFRRIALDTPRSRWLTEVVDRPLLVHWGAALFATAWFGLALALWVVLRVAGLARGTSLSDVALAAYALGVAQALWAATLGRRVVVRRVSVALAGLDPSLAGYRIAHVTDLHVGSFDRRAVGLRWAAKVNALGADLVVATGDFVTSGTGFFDDVADVLGAMRAKDGVLAVTGNHDQWQRPLLATTLESRGVRVLRNEWTRVERPGAALVVAGLDDFFTSHDDLDRTLADRPAGEPLILLSHYPSFFERAAARGVDLVLSGHTHGGQIGLWPLSRWLNVSALAHQHGPGLHRLGRAQLYVNAGLGTTGPPLRLGFPAEIALIELTVAAR